MKEWYLMTPNTRPNITGGFENDVYESYKEDAFSEVLMTDVASTVILYNYNLSVSNEIRCVIQGNTADTQLKSTERVGLFQIGTVKAGMYVFFENRYWLITSYPGNNGQYEKAVMSLCQYLLRWQNSKGEIVERWMTVSLASKNDNGENDSKVVVTSSNTFILLLPDDPESLEINDKRMFIDKKAVNPTQVYKITRNNGILYDYGIDHGGVLNFTADKTEFNASTDNQELRICDYFSPTVQPEDPDESTDSWVMKIDSVNTYIKPIGKTKTITAQLYDKDCNALDNDIVYVWTVSSNIDEYLTYSSSDKTFTISLSTLCEEFGEIINISVASKYTGQVDTVELIVEEVF